MGFLEENISKANIAEDLDPTALLRIGSTVKEGYENDLRSRADWEERNEDYLKLATQVVEPKNYPWPGAANIKYPLLSTAIQAFAARAYPALVPNANPVKGRVVGYDNDGTKMTRAINIGKHMSYQLIEEMEEWEDDMDRMCHIIPLVGSCFKKTYFSPILKRNISELVLPQNLVVDYYAKNLETAYRKTEKIFLSNNELYERVAAGVYLDAELRTPQPQDTASKTSGEVHGVNPSPQADSATEHLLLECHTFYDLDGDGYEEPYICTVAYPSGQVLRIVARYDEDSIQYTEGKEKQVLRIEPVEYYTKFTFIPSPDNSFYDLGFGSLLTPINETINTTVNQLLDAGTLSNQQSGFLSRGIRVKGGDYTFRPGEWKPVNSTGDDLRKGIVPLPVGTPSQVLFSLLEMMINSGRVLSSTIDAMVGEDSGQNQKATTTIAKIREGSRVFNAIYKRMHRSLKKEFKKLYRLNKLYLPDEAYFQILDPGQEKVSKIGRSDYQENIANVIPTSDPNVATEQERLAKAEALAQLIPLGTVNPQEVTKRILEAQDQYGIEQLMALPPAGPPPDFQLKMAELQHKIQMDQLNHQLEILKVKLDGIGTISDAEAKEHAGKLAVVKHMLDVLEQEAAVQAQQEVAPQQPTGGTNDQQASSNGMAAAPGNEGVPNPAPEGQAAVS